MTSLLPFPELQFFTNDGTPLALGTVETYVPGTLTPKLTWQDASQTVANENPVALNAAGRGIFFGFGDYRFVVRDSLGNLIYDQLTSSTLGESAISAVMLPVVSAATLATARDLMGITAAIAASVGSITLLTGPTGPQGIPGVTGPTGPAGTAGSVTLDRQTFGANGTWTKPDHGSIAFIQIWGSGGAGTNVSYGGGGGGGGYTSVMVPLTDLSATVAVTIGQGGMFNPVAIPGANGLDTSFGAYLVQAGGIGGGYVTNTDGSTGPVTGATGYLKAMTGLNLMMGSNEGLLVGGAWPQQVDNFGNNYGATSFSGSNGAALGTTPFPSIFGGNGGAPTASGNSPGGGGGVNGGSGGNGQVIVTVV